MSATAGNNSQKQSTTGLLAVMTSLFKEKKSTGKSRSRGLGTRTGTRTTRHSDTLPRSCGLDISGSDHSGGIPTEPTELRRSSDSILMETAHHSERGTAGVAPKVTVGLKTTETANAEGLRLTSGGGEFADIELGFPAVLIINYWKEKEQRKFDSRANVAVDPPLDYPPHRRYMVDWISEVGEQLGLQTVTIHSAVSFLDELMLLMKYDKKDWRLHAVCCLSVAAKYEEAECNMPMISELADTTEMSLTTPIVTRGELELVQRLQWDVSRVTAMHFVRYYTSQGITASDDTCQGRRLVNKVVMYMKKYVDFFANLCQQDYQFQQYLPSHVAAAAVLAARRALCILPMWRDELTDLTGYNLPDIVECGEELWVFYEKMFPTHKPLRSEPNAAATAAALKMTAEQQLVVAALSTAGRETAPASGSDRRVGSSDGANRAALIL